MFAFLVTATITMSLIGVPPKKTSKPSKVDRPADRVKPSLIGVLELENAAKLPEQVVDYLTDLTRGQVAERLPSSLYRVLTRDGLLEMIPPQSSLAACEGTCEVDTARRIGLDFVISGRVFAFADGLRLTLKMHAVKSSAFLGEGTAAAKDVLALDGAVQRVASDLVMQLPGAKSSRLDSRPGLLELTAVLAVSSGLEVPVRARIKLDGKLIEDSTPAVIRVPAGAHALEFIGPKDELFSTSIIVRSGGSTSIEAPLITKEELDRRQLTLAMEAQRMLQTQQLAARDAYFGYALSLGISAGVAGLGGGGLLLLANHQASRANSATSPQMLDEARVSSDLSSKLGVLLLGLAVAAAAGGLSFFLAAPQASLDGAMDR